MDSFVAASRCLREATHAVASTGAGISVGSGIPDFRGPCGLWQKYPPDQFATFDAFLSDPEKVWRLWRELAQTLRAAQPNPAHHALTQLQNDKKLTAIITQNVDNLHQNAGSKNVIEYHGNAYRLRCLDCDATRPFDIPDDAALPPRCSCGGLWKPDVVMFGEMIPQDAVQRADTLARTCDVFLSIGTSVEVYPAADLPRIAKLHGAILIEINIEPTPLTHSITDHFLQGPAGEVLPRLVASLA